MNEYYDYCSAVEKLKREYDTIDRELRALRETFNNRQDTWIKEKLGLEVPQILYTNCWV